ncbi:OmpA family protein [Propionivibrio sp.]|uniref:OmpA family protein n=1 Tax=Propionivibrio sp. TaxID=2212460 RepID=UPI003BF30FEE
MFASKKQCHVFGLAVGLLVLSSGLATAGDVTLYEKAPSVEELERQLTGGDGAGGKKQPRTRSIVFGDSAPAQQESAPAPVPQSDYRPSPAPQADYRPAPKPQARPQQSAPKQQAMQVGENAIAFPINFRVNSSEILPESIPFIESIAGLMQKDTGIRLLVEGHTDVSGNPARNITLSRERAYSVVNYLVERYRIEPTRLMPVGKGFSETLEGMDPTNPKNRRVQFRIIG